MRQTERQRPEPHDGRDHKNRDEQQIVGCAQPAASSREDRAGLSSRLPRSSSQAFEHQELDDGNEGGVAPVARSQPQTQNRSIDPAEKQNDERPQEARHADRQREALRPRKIAKGNPERGDPHDFLRLG